MSMKILSKEQNVSSVETIRMIEVTMPSKEREKHTAFIVAPVSHFYY